MNAVGVPDDVSTLVHEAGHCVPRLRRDIRIRSSGSAAAGTRPPSSRRCRWSCLPRRISRAPTGYYTREDAARAGRASRGRADEPAHIASVDAFQQLDLHERQGGDAARATRPGCELRAALRAGVDWIGARAAARRALVPPAAHLRAARSTTSSTASRSSARSRSGATSLATIRPPSPATARPSSQGDTVAPRDVPTAGVRLVFDADGWPSWSPSSRSGSRPSARCSAPARLPQSPNGRRSRPAAPRTRRARCSRRSRAAARAASSRSLPRARAASSRTPTCRAAPAPGG